MPYIQKHHRKFLDKEVSALAEKVVLASSKGDGNRTLDPGILNYAITKLILDLKLAESYTNYNAIMGVLAGVQQEHYRRSVAPYEDRKIADNGDIGDIDR